MGSLKDVIKFTRMLDAFRVIERVVRIPGKERYENDIEHSYMLALLAWYLIDLDKLSLDRSKVIHYALVHDLIEVYAGDTYVHTRDKAHLASKVRRERDALKRLKKEYPEFPSLFEWIEWYEKREDKESQFVYALDKFQPVLHIYLDGGRSWKENNVSFKDAWDKKKDKFGISDAVKPYFEELFERLAKEEEMLFGKTLPGMIK